LKYFGKTVQDPLKYSGSGLFWTRHLKVHGNDVSTEVIGFFESEEACTEAALRFSRENDIVKSELWANLKEENGVDGWQPGPMSEEMKDKLRKPKPEGFGSKVSSGLMGHEVSIESRRKMSEAGKGKIQSIEHRKKNSDANSGERNGNYGRKHTASECEAMRQNRKGKGIGNRNGSGPKPKVECRHCGRLIGVNRMWYHLKFCEE
jgi:hypothetical protein